jgi:thioredoxin reductase
MSHAAEEAPAQNFDVTIIGGGPAGLSAALYLARARRHTLVIDAGKPRNAVALASHGVFTRDGTPPLELLAEARRQLRTYPTVEFRHMAAVEASAVGAGFLVRLESGETVRSRRLILAVGVCDQLPPIEGVADSWGRRIFNCSYCHGFEHADSPLALLAPGQLTARNVASLFQFSRDIMVFTHHTGEITEDDRRTLEGWGVRVIDAEVLKVSDENNSVAVYLADGSVVVRSAMLLKNTVQLTSTLPVHLGCRLNGPSAVVDATWQTNVPGVYAVGDIATAKRFVVTAAASGCEAAVSIDGALTDEGFGSA